MKKMQKHYKTIEKLVERCHSNKKKITVKRLKIESISGIILRRRNMWEKGLYFTGFAVEIQSVHVFL